MIFDYIEKFIVYAFTPAIIVWAWMRFVKAVKSWHAFFVLSLVSLSLATLSSLLAVAFLLHWAHIDTIWIFDPLANFLANGVFASLASIVLALCGVWRRNPLRWPALFCALVSFPFWMHVGISA